MAAFPDLAEKVWQGLFNAVCFHSLYTALITYFWCKIFYTIDKTWPIVATSVAVNHLTVVALLFFMAAHTRVSGGAGTTTSKTKLC